MNIAVRTLLAAIGLTAGFALANSGARVPLHMAPGQVVPAAATASLPAASAVHAHPEEIRLWPGAAPGSEGKSGEETVTWRTERDSVTGEMFSFPTVSNIHIPTITPYLPTKEKATGVAVIVAPGGGHMFHTINHEGYDVAKSLADRGIAAFVLKYRLARAPSYPAGTYSIENHARLDGQRAVRLVRSRAAEWGINADKIGFLGFSAGGEVITQMNLNSTEGIPESSDPIDRLSCKKNFDALVYPGQSRLIIPTPDWPPVFLACAFDDRADIAGAAPRGNTPPATRPAAQGLADVYLRYKSVNVPAELHIYSTGGHGFGTRDRPLANARWMDRFTEWLQDRAILKQP